MKDYSIGLDIGTGSVGWVCLNSQYDILRYNNRPAFGVHEFEAAHVAEERRLKRGTRRRYNRRKKRIQLLQSLFAPHMSHLTFFSDVQSQHFWKNDNYFENRTLTEVLKTLRKSTRTYPTIFHLRKELIENPEKQDLRLIYLAIHNLTKFRGHFLQEGTTWNTKTNEANLGEQFEELMAQYADVEQIPAISFNKEQLEEAEQILLNNQVSKLEKARLLTELFGKLYEPLFKLIVGLEIKAMQLFKNSENQLVYKEANTKVSLNAEDLANTLQSLVEQEAELVERVQPFYQQTVLFHLLKGHAYVAAAKVASFELYEEQLKQLKCVINEVDDEKIYRQFFITSKKNQTQFAKKPKYELLCHLDRFNQEKKHEETFYKEVKKVLSSVEASTVSAQVYEQVQQIIQAIEQQSFLVKQKGIQNAAIPYQNSLYEVERILRNQQAYYPFMTNEWIEQVKTLIAFRIPYYIGPLIQQNNEAAPFGWLERETEGNITPWNFEERINKAASAEKFIQRMTTKCTYLSDQHVLPKQSLLYEKFVLLNELNSIQIRSTLDQPHKKYRLSEQMKQWLIEHVFKQTKTVTHKTVMQALKKSPFKDELYDANTDGWKEIYGTQKEDRFASSLSTYISLRAILGDVVEHTQLVEELIYWLTVFNEKDIITFKVNEKYPFITDEQIQRLVALNLSGWGKMSKQLLLEIPVDDTNRTVIEYMEKHSVNFMELLSPKYSDLAYKIEQLNVPRKKAVHKIRYEDIQELAGSPALKRGIWRAVKIVEELVSIFGEPKNIVIEVAREDGEKKRPKKRKTQWEDIGKSLGKEEKEVKAFIKEMAKHPDEAFDRNRFWLYVTQLGKCLYTGKPLNLHELSTYEIDHILPRNFVKDDSLNNLALVYPMANQQKNKAGQNKMPLEIIEAKDQPFRIAEWKRLNKLGLLSNSKLHKLLKPTFNDVDKEQFIARQLVETRQIIKHVRDLLQERFEHTEIHLVKAKIASHFRQFNRIPKLREYNNKHHAMDALFATALIQFVVNTYGQNFLQFDLQRKDITNKWSKIAQTHKNFFLFQQFAQQQIKSPVTKQLVSGVEYFDHVFYEQSWQTTKMTLTNDRNFYDETILSPKIKEAEYVSKKAATFVHNSVKNYAVYCVTYKTIKKNKEQQHTKLIDMKVIEYYQLKQFSEEALAYHLAARETKEEVFDAKIVAFIPKYKKILLDGSPYYCISTKERHNATQFVLPKNMLQVSLAVNDETPIEQLKELFAEIIEAVMVQYTAYNIEKMRAKFQTFIETELCDVEAFNKAFIEVQKIVAANGRRSDKFGGRLDNVLKAEKIKVVDESITGLYYRKPKKLVH